MKENSELEILLLQIQELEDLALSVLSSSSDQAISNLEVYVSKFENSVLIQQDLAEGKEEIFDKLKQFAKRHNDVLEFAEKLKKLTSQDLIALKSKGKSLAAYLVAGPNRVVRMRTHKG